MTWIWLSVAAAQSVNVAPYLQNVSPESAWILWETNGADASVVEWGETASLGQMQSGTSFINQGSAWVHEVELTGLSPDTRYHYRIMAADGPSDIHDFITPPEPTSDQGFRLVAMSDMQIDYSNSDKFREMVEDGVIDYIEDTYSADLPEELGLVLIPGDLVENGNTFGQWSSHFFGPAAALSRHVPIYPVPGNHENNAQAFFNYFNLPTNGTPGYEEHWWYKDYANLRVIGLDSNSGYRLDTQLAWLDSVLEDACTTNHIDFVFAQLHHPHKSELWLDGEIDYTGEVIERMEQFSTDCGKPGLHFFGHTHGYSRGQSRDHQHLWVNVASAGGNLDYWGEYAQNDYEEFTVSQAEWGFVVVEVEAGDSPTFTLRRISRGDETAGLDNVVRDEIMIARDNVGPDTPNGISPAGADINPQCNTLEASDYSDSDGDLHGASQWQLAEACDDFSQPLYESWRQHENWYGAVDTQAGDDLTDEVTISLSGEQDYCWRVRYRDRSLTWSDWSEPVAFSTLSSEQTENLLENPGAEDGTTGWTVREGYMQSLTDGECNGIAPHSGKRYFAVGGLCGDTAAYAEVVQTIDVSKWSNQIDKEAVTAVIGGYLSNWSGQDTPELAVAFFDEGSNEIGQSDVISNTDDAWVWVETSSAIPPMTRSIEVMMMGTRNSGTDNDSYFDDLALRLMFGECGGDDTTDDTGSSDTGGEDTGTESTDSGEASPPENDPPVQEDSSRCGCAGSGAGLLLLPLLLRRKQRK